MPKSLTATDLTIEGLSIQTNEAGAVRSVSATVNVAYGETRVREEFDLWAELTATQRNSFQTLYDKLTQRLQTTYLA